MSDALAQGQADVHFVRLNAVQTGQTANRRERPDGIERHIPAGQVGQSWQWRWCKLQLLLQPARQAIGQRGFNVAAKLGPECLGQAMGVLLLPQEAATDEQAVMADRHVAAGHDIAWQPSDVAAVPQNSPSLVHAYRPEGREGHGAADTDRRSQRQRPRRRCAEKCGPR